MIRYEGKAADQLEKSYRGRDVVAQRAEVLRRLALRPGERVLDIGSGPGFLTDEMAKAVGPQGHVLGVDLSDEMVARATARNTRAWVAHRQGDATALPVPDASVDVVVSTQVAEYMVDLAPYAAEIARVLRPGGRGLVLTTDWTRVLWHSADPARMMRVFDAYNGSVARHRVPQELAPHLRAAGLCNIEVGCFEITNLDRRDGAFSAGTTEGVLSFIRSRGTVPEDVLSAWAEEQDQLEADGAYFFSLGRYIFTFARPA